MKDGVIADFKVTEKMLNYFIHKAHNRKMLVHPRIVIGVPSEITQVEKRAVMDSAYRAKASEVHLVEQAMVAAIGAGLPITEPGGNMVVDIGTLGADPESAPIPEQKLQTVALRIGEKENMPAQRIACKPVAHQPVQAFKTFAHVRRSGGKIDSRCGPHAEHQPCSSTATS
jgi:hypothetical protein